MNLKLGIYVCQCIIDFIIICYRVTWVQVQGTKYVGGSVVVLDSLEVHIMNFMLIYITKTQANS